MKKWLIFVMICLFSLPAAAKISWGVRAGLSYSSLTQIIDEEVTYGGRMGFNIAGLMDIPLSNRFSLRPELAFVSQGGAYDYIYTVDEEVVTGRHTCVYYTAQIPVNLAYKIYYNEWILGLQAGPFVSLSTREREKNDWNVRDFRSFDIGAGAGLYVEYKKAYFSVYANTGFLDRLKEKQPRESQIYQNNVTFSFGYWFH